MSDVAIQTVAQNLGRDSSARFNRRMPGHGNGPRQADKEQVLSDGMLRLVTIVSAFGLVTALVILIVAHFLGNEIAKGGYSDDKRLHEIVIGNDVISIPANLIRFSAQRRSGVSAKTDLYLHWPSLRGYSEDLKNVFTTINGQRNIVFVSLEPRTMPLDMAGRIEPIYSKFFDGKAVKISNGLVRQPLSADSGYLDEDLVIEVNSPYPFVARCLRDQNIGGEPYCIRDIHLGNDLMVSYRFHSQLLPNWLELDRSVRNKLKSMLET